jgi:hypothetical protein
MHIRKLKEERKWFEKGYVDYFFLAQGTERKEVINGKKIHPFANTLDPYLDGRKLEILEYDFDPATHYYGSYRNIDPLIRKVALRNSFRKLMGKELPPVSNFTAFMKILEQRKIKLRFSEEGFKERLEEITSLASVFEKLFEKSKAKAVFFSVYFKKVNFAASLACRKLSIKCIEIQHGQQGKYNPQNNGFARIPPGGYELLPTHFWAWGEESVAYKNDLCEVSSHKAFAGGNPWLNAWLYTKQFSDNETEEATNSKPQILLALQPLPEPLPRFLLDVISSTKGKFSWRVRLHPHMIGRMQEIENILRHLDADIEIRLATQMPLYSLLKRSEFVITMWSTVAYEALYFGARPVIIHPNGQEIMREYIEKGFFDCALDQEVLLSCLLNKNGNQPKELPHFIETGMEKNIRIVRSILKGS